MIIKMNKILSNQYFLVSIRIVLGFVFIFAAISKAAEPEAFAKAIYNYKLLPLFLINILAITLPWIELSAGLLLVFGVSVKENSAILSGMLLVFIIAIAISLARGLNIDCGCFGTVDGSKVGLMKILENIGLLLLGLILIKFDLRFLSLAKHE
jgi:putative oxidoreductase